MNKLLIKSKIIGGITLYTYIILLYSARVEVFEVLSLINSKNFLNLIVDILKFDYLGTISITFIVIYRRTIHKPGIPLNTCEYIFDMYMVVFYGWRPYKIILLQRLQLFRKQK